MRTRLRAEAGMGLVELLIAMTVLAVALLALVAAFSSGALTLQRAGQTSTASVLANQQMELYRGLKYCSIRLDDGSLPGPTPYASDPAYSGSQVLDTAVCGGSTPTCTAVAWPDPCNASQSISGSDTPDGRSYRIDTYIIHETVPPGRELKKVTIVVRNGNDVTAQALVRTSSKFDQISG